MSKIIRLTENDLTRIVKKVIAEQDFNYSKPNEGQMTDEERENQINRFLLDKKNGWIQKNVRGHKYEKLATDGSKFFHKGNLIFIMSPTKNYFFDGIKLIGPFSLFDIPKYI